MQTIPKKQPGEVRGTSHLTPNGQNGHAGGKKEEHSAGLNAFFRRFASCTAEAVGSKWAFLVALILIVVWAILGPVFHYSDTWQLVINTSTTIVTFLVVFLIQNTQNRDAKAIHLKLDELIKGLKGARNSMVDLEDLSDEELREMQKQFAEFHTKATQENDRGDPEDDEDDDEQPSESRTRTRSAKTRESKDVH